MELNRQSYMTQAKRRSFAEKNGGIDGLRTGGHAALAGLLETSLLLDQLAEAVYMGDTWRAQEIAAAIKGAEAKEVVRA